MGSPPRYGLGSTEVPDESSRYVPRAERCTVNARWILRRPIPLVPYPRLMLSELTGIPQSTISAIENDRVNLGIERAKVIARALRCHPAVLVFPGWDVREGSAAQCRLDDMFPRDPHLRRAILVYVGTVIDIEAVVVLCRIKLHSSPVSY